MIRLLFPEFCSIKEDHGVVSVLFNWAWLGNQSGWWAVHGSQIPDFNLRFFRTVDRYQCVSMFLFEILAVAENHNDQLVSQISRFLMLPEKPLFSFIV